MKITDAERVRRWTYETVSEKQLQASIIEVATLTGWLVYHTFDSRKCTPGYPDLTMIHPSGDALFWELKTEKGRVTAHQKKWIAALLASGLEAGIVRPSDIDAIIIRLQRGKQSNAPEK